MKGSFVDVDKLKDLPVLDKGYKYFPCIGGTRNYRCFVESVDLSRGDFLEKYDKVIPEVIRPVYSAGNILVKQDAQYAVPGFFIVSPKKRYKTIAELPDSLLCECADMISFIKENMLKLPEINDVFIYYDENYKKPSFVHFWVLPVFKGFNVSVLDGSVWAYLESFEYCCVKDKIKCYNSYMKTLLAEKVTGKENE